MTQGIYSLKFNGTKKQYIGQSKNIEKRFIQHINSLGKGSAIKKLQDAYFEFGSPTLHILLEWPIEDELRDLEEAAISFLDTINNGFNSKHSVVDHHKLSGKGSHLSKYSKEEYVRAMFCLAYYNKTIKDLSIILNMSAGTLYSMKAGKTHKDLKLEYPEEYSKMRLHKIVN